MKNILHAFLIMLLSITSYLSEAATNDEQKLTEAEIAQALAPIALYPDSVLTHILIASTYPLEVIAAHRWVSSLDDEQISEQALEKQDWDPSIKALTAFPKILQKLNDELKWTQTLGDAFLQDEAMVLTTIQTLRKKAKVAGNLDNIDNLTVTTEEDNIIIQPVTREIVYVPYYDTRTVYGNWHWTHYPPVYWHHNHQFVHHTGHRSSFYWYPRVHISYNFYFNAFHWHNRHVVVIDHHNSHYYSRRHIITHKSARRWGHDPIHRRGVAYKSVHVTQKYNSNRDSRGYVNSTRKVAPHVEHKQKIKSHVISPVPAKYNVVNQKLKQTKQIDKHQNLNKKYSEQNKVIKKQPITIKKTEHKKQVDKHSNKNMTKVTTTKDVTKKSTTIHKSAYKRQNSASIDAHRNSKNHSKKTYHSHKNHSAKVVKSNHRSKNDYKRN